MLFPASPLYLECVFAVVALAVVVGTWTARMWRDHWRSEKEADALVQELSAVVAAWRQADGQVSVMAADGRVQARPSSRALVQALASKNISLQ